MASTLVVLAANGRRANARANPNTTLSEVLQSACKSLRLNADQFGLKTIHRCVGDVRALTRHNGKPLDLSLTFRLSGLPNHTQLELVQASRSPSVVSVALQLPPPSDGSGSGSGSHGPRLMGKFASSTSIWQILRQFESGAAATTTAASSSSSSLHPFSSSSSPSSTSTTTTTTSTAPSPTYNFTERAVPVMSSGEPATPATAATATTSAGAGRLCYQMPVVEFMGRELAGMEELQRTLAQLGLSGGSALLRLSFRRTEQPLEDAIANISHFFKSDTDTEGIDKNIGDGVAREGDVDMNDEITTSKGNMSEEVPAQKPHAESHPATQISQPQQPLQPLQPSLSSLSSSFAADSTSAESHINRAVSIFAPPTNHTPQATTFAHNPDDYETTVESARIHQSRLAASSRNKRLLSDKEIDEVEKTKKEKINAVREVVVRVRLPDQSQVQSTFGKDDRAASLYTFVRNLINNEDHQPFTLRYTGEKGTQVIINDGEQLLTKDLLFQGRVLVNFVWDDTVPLETRQKSILKPKYQEQAKNIEVEAPQFIQKPTNGEAQGQGKNVSSNGVSNESKNQSKEQKMKRFLGKLTRK